MVWVFSGAEVVCIFSEVVVWMVVGGCVVVSSLVVEVVLGSV